MLPLSAVDNDNLSSSISSLTDSYINFVRVSLAVAIVKSKPDNIKDGKAYAQILCQRLKDQQNDWKKEYERVKHELLCLKQTQVLKRLESGERVSGVLTPPQTQDSQQTCSGNSEPIKPDNSQGHSPEGKAFPLAKLTSHHIFLNKIAAMKDFTSGTLVILNSAALPTVIETFCDSLEALKDSLLSTGNTDKECNDMRVQLARCLVELLDVSAGVSRCRQVQKELENFHQVCVQRILSPPESFSEQTLVTTTEVCRLLKSFSKYPPSALYMCKYIMSRISMLTQRLASASFKTLTQDLSLLTEAENVPRVTMVLLTAHRLRMKSANSGQLDPFVPLLELMNLRENLGKTLGKFPLYTVHIREVLTKTGHNLPTDGEWSDS